LLDFAEDDVVLLDFPELLVFSDFFGSGGVRKVKEREVTKNKWWIECRKWVVTRTKSRQYHRLTFEVTLNNFFACFARVGFSSIASEDARIAL
jgi:hypothetical protein